MNVPADLKYTKSHEWIRIDGDIATVGITDHAQSELGDIVYLDLPEAGRTLHEDESFGSVESVKAVSEVYAPIAGVVVERNETLNAQSDLVNSDPYGGGWLVKIQVSDASALEGLLSAEDYQKEL